MGLRGAGEEIKLKKEMWVGRFYESSSEIEELNKLMDIEKYFAETKMWDFFLYFLYIFSSIFSEFEKWIIKNTLFFFSSLFCDFFFLNENYEFLNGGMIKLVFLSFY